LFFPPFHLFLLGSLKDFIYYLRERESTSRGRGSRRGRESPADSSLSEDPLLRAGSHNPEIMT